MCIKINIVFISDVYYNKHFVMSNGYYNKHCVIADVYYNKHCVYI